MPFVIKRRLDLSGTGDGWAEAYIEYNPIRSKDSDQLLDIQKYRQKILANDIDAVRSARGKTMQIIVDNFLGGMGYDGEKLAPITKENLDELPDDILTELFQLITGQIDAKKNKLSQT